MEMGSVSGKWRNFVVVIVLIILIFINMTSFLAPNQLDGSHGKVDIHVHPSMSTSTNNARGGDYVLPNPYVRLKTNYGNMVIELYINDAPKTVNNFLKYVNDEFYSGLIFHRVINDFVIQGGGYYPDLTEKEATYSPIELEISSKLRHIDGAVAMARTNDPNSATCQFYICDGAQSFLDDEYAVFGQVVDGIDVMRSIASVSTNNEGGYSDVPEEDVIITNAYTCTYPLPPLTTEDFEGLSYSDPTGDDYTLYIEGTKSNTRAISNSKSISIPEDFQSYGVKGKYPLVDIINLQATLESGTVTVILELAANIGSYYYPIQVYFVDSMHQHVNAFSKPSTLEPGILSWDYSDQEHTLLRMKLSSGHEANSYPHIEDVTGEINKNKIVFTIPASELEDLGIESNSDFGLYAYSERLDSWTNNGGGYEITWDAVGVGARAGPDEFNVELYNEKHDEKPDDKAGSEDSDMTFLIVGVGIIIVIIIITIVLLRLRKNKHKPELPKQPPYSSMAAQAQYPPYLQPAQQTPGSQPTQPCNNCGSSLQFVQQYQRWYCDNCGEYK
jgi:cyclophilin family peptidyl-prolyl cis-trans isomerase